MQNSTVSQEEVLLCQLTRCHLTASVNTFGQVSWPRVVFMSTPVEDLDSLHRRISKAEIASAGKQNVVFCC